MTGDARKLLKEIRRKSRGAHNAAADDGDIELDSFDESFSEQGMTRHEEESFYKEHISEIFDTVSAVDSGSEAGEVEDKPEVKKTASQRSVTFSDDETPSNESSKTPKKTALKKPLSKSSSSCSLSSSSSSSNTSSDGEESESDVDARLTTAEINAALANIAQNTNVGIADIGDSSPISPMRGPRKRSNKKASFSNPVCRVFEEDFEMRSNLVDDAVSGSATIKRKSSLKNAKKRRASFIDTCRKASPAFAFMVEFLQACVQAADCVMYGICSSAESVGWQFWPVCQVAKRRMLLRLDRDAGFSVTADKSATEVELSPLSTDNSQEISADKENANVSIACEMEKQE